MSRYHAYLKRAEQVIQAYPGHPPLAAFLKLFFRQYPQMGSKDRKWVSHLVYAYFRCKQVLAPTEFLTQQIAWAHGLLVQTPDAMTALLPNDFQAIIPESTAHKLRFLRKDSLALFPWMDEVSKAIEPEEFATSHLQQPAVFIRTRPGKNKQVLQALQQADIPVQLIRDDILHVPSNANIDKLITLDRDAVIQDRSSAQIYDAILPAIRKGRTTYPLVVWDCCAASGGKSILLTDLLSPQIIQLTATDVRSTILYNLQQRFHRAGIKHYTHYVKDLALSPSEDVNRFDIILADVPCSGSGTWGRTPEQLAFFDAKTIPNFQQLQRRIVEHALPALKAGGLLIYSTCSVFEAENEAQVNWMQEALGINLLQQQYVTGYSLQADSLFVALLQKPDESSLG